MPTKLKTASLPVAVTLLLLLVAVSLHGEPAATRATEEAPADPAPRISVDEARRQSKLLHKTYESALHVIHRRYFDSDEKETIPAKALEDIFRDADEGTARTTRWVAVNTPAMNVDHEPAEGFETEAAKALTAGDEEYESVENGIYKRAGALRLFASCLRCHESGLTKQITKVRVAALVITLPVHVEEPAK